VQRLAALLRLADSLDRAHQQIVRQVRAEIRPNQLVLHLEATAPVMREVRAAQGKATWPPPSSSGMWCSRSAVKWCSRLWHNAWNR